MKIEKLPSGSYRVRKVINGKRRTFTFENKPTQKEILSVISNAMNDCNDPQIGISFRTASIKYVDMKRNVLSPRTIKEYSETSNRLDDWFCDLLIDDITQVDINNQINILSASKSPKTVRNYHGFISAVIKTFRPDMVISTTLPQKIKNDPYIPTDDDIKRILSEARGTIYELPFKVACYGLRRSELLCITSDDIVGDDTIRINKAMVLNDANEWIVKTTKTTASDREVILPKEIIAEIKSVGYVYKGYPNQINDCLTRIQTKLGIKHFTLHKFRHYFCSKLISMGVDIKTIQALGGWETDYVPRMVYAHVMSDKLESSKRDASRMIAESIGQNWS